ncbi:MAG: hypothetical protein P9L88_04670 [Candidatus Tantalella remota]|nr:hypothetical protein [Candidatus Tantalella remota]
MEQSIGQLINMIEVIFITSQYRGDLFNVFANGIRKADIPLKEEYAGNEDAEAIIKRIPAFIAVATIIHKFHNEKLEDK